MESSSPTRKNTNKTGQKLFRLIETLGEMNGAGVTELSKELGYAKSTTHRYLATLDAAEYVVKEGQTYYLSIQFLRLGNYARERQQLYQLVEPKVKQLAEETNERSQFFVEEHGTVVFVYRETGTNAVKADSGIGKRLPMHATAAGKVMLAFLPNKRLEEIIETHGLPELTENTITSIDSLRDELDAIRERGFSYNKQENISGLHAVGVPTRANGRPVGALTVAGPTHRLTGKKFETEIPDLLLGVANELELKNTYDQ